jgi:uncharacterized protein YutE (UPF0331/DUF86 family)
MSPGKLDFEAVRKHLLALDQALAQLERHTGKDVQVMIEDLDERWTVERGLQLCVQNVLDVATHLVATAGRDAPDYTAAIEQLGQIGIIPGELAMKLRPLAGFRNALVHGYLGVDIARVHAVLNGHLDQVRAFARHVDQHLQAAAGADEIG